jgi:hypothetical protein
MQWKRSPLNLADRIVCRLLIGQRVNVLCESIREPDQIVDALAAKKMPVTAVLRVGNSNAVFSYPRLGCPGHRRVAVRRQNLQWMAGPLEHCRSRFDDPPAASLMGEPADPGAFGCR